MLKTKTTAKSLQMLVREVLNEITKLPKEGERSITPSDSKINGLQVLMIVYLGKNIHINLSKTNYY